MYWHRTYDLAARIEQAHLPCRVIQHQLRLVLVDHDEAARLQQGLARELVRLRRRLRPQVDTPAGDIDSPTAHVVQLDPFVVRAGNPVAIPVYRARRGHDLVQPHADDPAAAPRRGGRSR